MTHKAIDYFLYPVDSVNDLAESVRKEAEKLPPQAIHRMFIVPPQDFPIIRFKRFGDLPFGWRKTPRRVLMFGDQQIAAINIEPSELCLTVLIPLDSLVSIELTTVLLRAHLELTWVGAHQIETCKIEFNAVGELMIRKEINYIRSVIASRMRFPEPDQPEVSIADFPLKYRNYLRYALLPNERLLTAIYQPAMQRQSQRWLRAFISPNRAIGITNQHLLLVEDERQSFKADYGVVTRFMPLAALCGVTFESSLGATWVRFTLGTAQTATEISIPLQPDQAVILRSALQKEIAVPILEAPAAA